MVLYYDDALAAPTRPLLAFSSVGKGSLKRINGAARLVFALLPILTLASASRPVNLPFKDLAGKKVKVSDLRGKPVVLNFWATWCVPCRAEMPLLVDAEKQYAPKGVAFIAASLDDRTTRPKIPE